MLRGGDGAVGLVLPIYSVERLPDGRVAVRQFLRGEGRDVIVAVFDDWEEAEAFLEVVRVA